MIEQTSRESKDKLLFNKIAENYSKKDLFAVSMIPRKSILETAMKPVLENFGHVNTIIEIGCGIGAPAKYLKDHYHKYIGIDQSEKMIKIAQKYNNGNRDASFLSKNVKDLDIENSADLILLSGVLHHMTDLGIVLDKLIKLLKPGGAILAIEPQSFNPLIQIMRYIRKIIDKNYSKEQTFFSEKELTVMFEKKGIKIKNINYLGYFSPPFAQIIFKPEFLFKPLSIIATALDRLLSKYLPRPLNRLSFNISIFGIKEKK